MKRILPLLLLLVAAYLGYQQQSTPDMDGSGSTTAQAPADINQSAPASLDDANRSELDKGLIEQAFAAQRSNLQVEIQGTVSRVLSDDNNGSRHQRFIVRLPSGHTLLVAHNIDLAERVADLQPGDTISIYGEYEWNVQGGVMHWTHHDPDGSHVAGWIKHRSHTYQ